MLLVKVYTMGKFKPVLNTLKHGSELSAKERQVIIDLIVDYRWVWLLGRYVSVKVQFPEF